MRGGGGGSGGFVDIIFSTEMVLSAELDTEGLGSMLAALRVFLGLLGEGVGPE